MRPDRIAGPSPAMTETQIVNWEELHGEEHQGAGDFSRPVRRRRGPVQFLGRDLQMGGGSRLQGRADPELGRPHLRSEEGCRRPRPIATRSRARPRRQASTITELSTHLQGQLVAVNPAFDEAFDAFAPKASARQSEGAAEMGGRAGQARRQGLAQSRPRLACVLHRRARLALRLSVAAAPAGPDRGRLR